MGKIRTSKPLAVGGKIIVNGTGVFSSEGVPVNCDGKKATIQKVGTKLLTVLIDGETFPRKIRIESHIKRRISSGV